MKDFKEFNRWWENPDTPFKEQQSRQRFVYDKMKWWAEKRFMYSLSGLRRLGKTTIFRQFIHELLQKREIEPKKIFLYQFSETDNDLESVLRHYFNSVLNEDLYSLKAYIFLDELQYVDKWQVTLKHYYDINPEIRFYVSGSSSLLLHKDTKESLAGRIIDFSIHPMGFHEYLYLKNGVTRQSLDLLQENLSEQLKKMVSQYVIYQNEFDTYLIYGEFPQIIKDQLFSEARVYFNEAVLDKIFNKDIQIFQIDKKKELRLIYEILAQDTAQFINKSNIARDIQLSQPTVTNYIEILKQAFLINYSYNYLRSIRAREKAFRKGYVTSINLACTVLGIERLDHPKFSDVKGHLIETYVYNSLHKQYKDDVYFYHRKQKEVDIVIEKGLTILPIEVKIKPEIKDYDFRHLYDFMEKHKLKKGVVVYGGPVAERTIQDKHFTLIPYYLLD